MLGAIRSPFEILLLFATDSYVLFATAATFLMLTPIGRIAVTRTSGVASGALIGLIVRVPLVALLVAPSFSRPDHQYQLAYIATVRISSTGPSGRIIGAILGASYFLPLSLWLGIATVAWPYPLLPSAAAAVLAMLSSTCLSVAIIALLFRFSRPEENTQYVIARSVVPDNPESHKLSSVLFWTLLTVVALLVAATPYPAPLAALILAGSVIAAIYCRKLQLRALLTSTGTYVAALLLFAAIAVVGGILSQLLAISGLPQEFVLQYRSGNQVQAILVVCIVVFIFSSMFGTLISLISLSAALGPAVVVLSDLSGPWPLVSILLILKITSTVSPLGFINNAASADTPMIRGYLGRLRILFPVLAADVIVLVLLIVLGSAMPQL